MPNLSNWLCCFWRCLKLCSDVWFPQYLGFFFLCVCVWFIVWWKQMSWFLHVSPSLMIGSPKSQLFEYSYGTFQLEYSLTKQSMCIVFSLHPLGMQNLNNIKPTGFWENRKWRTWFLMAASTSWNLGSRTDSFCFIFLKEQSISVT